MASEEEAERALATLQEMGFDTEAAARALMKTGGELLAAADLLTASAERDNGGKETAADRRKARKQKKAQKAASGGGGGGGGGGTNRNRVESPNSPQLRPTSAGLTPNSPSQTYQDKRARAREAKQAKKNARQICQVCGGPHRRRECPGVEDGGKGQSVHRGKSKQLNKGRKHWDTDPAAVADGRSPLHPLGPVAHSPSFDCYSEVLAAAARSPSDPPASFSAYIEQAAAAAEVDCPAEFAGCVTAVDVLDLQVVIADAAVRLASSLRCY